MYIYYQLFTDWNSNDWTWRNKHYAWQLWKSKENNWIWTAGKHNRIPVKFYLNMLLTNYRNSLAKLSFLAIFFFSNFLFNEKTFKHCFRAKTIVFEQMDIVVWMQGAYCLFFKNLSPSLLKIYIFYGNYHVLKTDLTSWAQTYLWIRLVWCQKTLCWKLS